MVLYSHASNSHVVFFVHPKVTLKEIDFHPLKKRVLNDRD
jgi:hypothetical protein